MTDPLHVEIPPLDESARKAAISRQQSLTKPPGSLGQLETVAAEIAAIQATTEPAVDPAAIITMAADHGVASEGVSAYPQSVTTAMTAAVDEETAAINAIAGAVDTKTVLVDMGVAGDVPDSVIDYSVRNGTANMAAEPAMTRTEARQSITAGRQVVRRHAADCRMIGLGELGIGNTTASAAITALVTDESVDAVTGHGTGIDEATRQRKVDIIKQAIDVTAPDPDDPLSVLRCVGGLEIGGLVGVTLEAASQRTPVVVDGFIAGAAALLAVEIEPRVADYLLGSHESVEPGHAAQLAALDLKPGFDFELRLGEGTAAALAIGIYRAACRAHTEMATFEESGIEPEE